MLNEVGVGSVFVPNTVGSQVGSESFRTYKPQESVWTHEFLVVCNFSLQVIEDYAEIARSFTELLHNNTPFKWGEPQESPFQLVSAPSLAYPDKDKIPA